MIGRIEAIHIGSTAGAAMTAVDAVEAIADGGLRGDRYLTGSGFYSSQPREDGGRQLTLIESETLTALAAEYGVTFSAADSRRNLTTRDIRLADLIGRRFTIGGITCVGVDHCPPCQHLVEITGQPVLKPLVGRGGIRARIVAGGRIQVGDVIGVAVGDEGA